MATLSSPSFSVIDYLAEERGKDLFRFSTAGSVDDGKSTLIGRLLYDTQSVYEDQVRAIEGKGTTVPGQIDFALLTDGLRAEREQGITIDVAYRFFSTARRKFIIADTPGHEQYTRNMATGASTADAAVVLIDASKGVLEQSLRHAYIASLLGVRHIVVAINKMDLIGYAEQQFRSIEHDFSLLLNRIAQDTGNPVDCVFVPVSALAGDNIVHRSSAMNWYAGQSLLEVLESLPPSRNSRLDPFRFPVQRVIRPSHTFRGFAGQIASGTVTVGDFITVLPSGKTAQVTRIVTFDGDLESARSPLSVTLVLDREIDISRGDLIVAAGSQATVARNLDAALVWMDLRPLQRNRRYLLKHTSQTVPAVITAVNHRTHVGTLQHEAATTLELNGIGEIALHLMRPIAVDLYRHNRNTGAFILVDPETNSTVAAGMIHAIHDSTAQGKPLHGSSGPLTAEERSARWGHRGGVLDLKAPEDLVDLIERDLLLHGFIAVRINADDPSPSSDHSLLDAVVQRVVDAGLIALIAHQPDSDEITAHSGSYTTALAADSPAQAIAAVHELLRRAEIAVNTQKAGLQ